MARSIGGNYWRVRIHTTCLRNGQKSRLLDKIFGPKQGKDSISEKQRVLVLHAQRVQPRIIGHLHVLHPHLLRPARPRCSTTIVTNVPIPSLTQCQNCKYNSHTFFHATYFLYHGFIHNFLQRLYLFVIDPQT